MYGPELLDCDLVAIGLEALYRESLLNAVQWVCQTMSNSLVYSPLSCDCDLP